MRRSMEFHTYTGERTNNLTDVTEIVKEIRNRCDMYLLLMQEHYCGQPVDGVVPTLLKDMYQDCKAIMERQNG